MFIQRGSHNHEYAIRLWYFEEKQLIIYCVRISDYLQCIKNNIKPRHGVHHNMKLYVQV